MRPLTLVVGGALVLSTLLNGLGRTEENSQTDLGNLWTECQKVAPFVFYTPLKHAPKPYPTEESIDTIIRNRLRAVRLYPQEEETSWAFLFISILPMAYEPDNSLNMLTLISFGFNKRMYDPWTGTYRHAVVWSRESWSGAGRLHAHISGLMDTFLDEYLRVNESACQRK